MEVLQTSALPLGYAALVPDTKITTWRPVVKAKEQGPAWNADRSCTMVQWERTAKGLAHQEPEPASEPGALAHRHCDLSWASPPPFAKGVGCPRFKDTPTEGDFNPCSQVHHSRIERAHSIVSTGSSTQARSGDPSAGSAHRTSAILLTAWKSPACNRTKYTPLAASPPMASFPSQTAEYVPGDR